MRILTLLSLSCFLLMGSISAEEKAHWDYTGAGEPNVWGTLSPKFERCSKGQNQSPINLAHFIDADLQPITFEYATQTTEFLNNGHTVQANYAAGSTITFEGKSFELKQFHFHASSEHQIKGQSFPLEAHLVHADSEGNLAVVGIVFKMGEENKTLDQLSQKMPHKAGDTHALTSINAESLLPDNKSYYRYNGSLTTPPCTEGVRWIVMQNAITASKNQIDTFAKVMHHQNNRPIQPVNARPVLH
ncbi:MAG: carbonic anhydrase [Candidatus Latescibacterota bacterium]|jgi:carbonic anhydrase